MQPLRAWLAQNDVFCDGRLALERNARGHAHVVALASIPTTTTVGRIPKSLVLSHRTSSLSLDDAARSALDSFPPALRLAVHVFHELLLGRQSRWDVYLASCPTEEVPIALLWNDGEPSTWLKGTQVEREARKIGINRTGLRDVYTSTTVPLLLRQTYPTAPSFDKFVLAYSLVSSRAFQVDAFHSLALVPLADAFNHSDPPHVHFASEMWVCPECGKLDRCGHDEDGEVSARAADRVSPEEDDTCDMVVERAIQAGEEVFNTYGQLSNAKLLTSYGFLLEANERDTIEFALDEAAEACLPRIPSDPLVEQYEHLGTFSCLSTIEDNHPLLCTTDSAELSIDADARLSTSLWVMLVAAATLAAGGCSTKEMLRMTVAQLVDVVEVLAREQEAGEEEEPGKAERFAPSLDDVTIIQHIRQAVLRLCQAYRSRQHRAELGAADLLDLAEETEDAKVRLALEYLAGERLILERVEQRWSTLI